MFGIPVGVPALEMNGEKVLALMDAPLELEYSLRGWLWSHPELVREDSPAYALRLDERERIAITWETWEQYLDWVQRTLAAALAGRVLS
ncbi:hypothetical protein [Burkholderia vietnamiensis]|uniref:hypothetical protein n=1 Tax=Burkholderia vietnamiensis TaxID=60552 RepID=UPI0026535B22|nr:hypothetical protein [Burkholderia vietnamiensis]MDN8071519.1 hypothetical protein [Burkholderia vietnamiensis]